MYIAGAIPAPNEFLVKSIRAALFDRRGELIPVGSKYYRGAKLELRILQKRYWQAPLWRCADPIAILCRHTGILELSADERKELIRSLRVALGEGVLIQCNQPFSVDLEFDHSFDWHRIDSPGSLVVLLEGTESRAQL